MRMRIIIRRTTMTDYNEEQMRKLDAQGRHRSEWCYAAYDGRKDREIPHGVGYEIHRKDRPEQRHTK